MTAASDHPRQEGSAAGQGSSAEPEKSRSERNRSLVLTSVGGAVLFLLLRVLAVADWNWHTAFAITHTVDFDDAIGIALGTLMANEAATGVLLVWLLPVSVLAAAWPLPGGRRTMSAFLLAATMIAATTALVSTDHAWWVVGSAAVIGALLVLVRLFWNRGAVHRVFDFVVRRAGVTALLAALVLAALVPTPWVPLERIELEGETVIGYVMESRSGFQKVLTADEHELLIIPNTEITLREEIVED